MVKNAKKLAELARLIRYYILYMSTQAGSGHPTSSLSAADLLTVLFFGGFLHFDLASPQSPANDRVIFSKGHASPLYYALFAAAGVLSKEDLSHYRQLTSPLEGHPTPTFVYTEAAAGSLGQGLAIGFGMALALAMDYGESSPKNHNSRFMLHDSLPHVFVLLGDGDMAEGSNWETIAVAGHYRQSNLVGIIDVNRLGQSGETMYGHDTLSYKRRVESFAWEAVTIDGHNLQEIAQAFRYSQKKRDQPLMIIAKTIKGKGVSFLEGVDGWHGKALPQEQFDQAVKELGPVDLQMRMSINKPSLREIPNSKFQIPNKIQNSKSKITKLHYKLGDLIATRKAYGEALTVIGARDQRIVALDADVKNSTFSEIFKAAYPDRFFEMYIAEQNMVGAAVGLARRGQKPFVSTFAAFLTRTFDQIRMAAISRASIRFCGSHAGVSIGEDGPSQMGLEDLAMFRAVSGSTVLYPSDAVSTARLVEMMAKSEGIVYLRTTRPATPVIYKLTEKFPIGGSKVHRIKNYELRIKNKDGMKAVVVAAGITLHEALKAQQKLAEEGIETVVIDCYSIKPIDAKTLRHAVSEGRIPRLRASTELSRMSSGQVLCPIVVVEDHWFEGGLGDAVLNVFADEVDKPRIVKLAVGEMPRSGKPEELLAWAGIDAAAIVKAVKSLPHE